MLSLVLGPDGRLLPAGRHHRVAGPSRRPTPLTAATSPTFAIDRAPAGVAQVDAQAFASACGSIASAVPTYVAETPGVRSGHAACRRQRGAASHPQRPPVGVGRLRRPAVDLDVARARRSGRHRRRALWRRPDRGLPAADRRHERRDARRWRRSSTWATSRTAAAAATRRYFQFVFDNVNASAKPFLYTPGRQRMDRLPPRQQRRLRSAGAAGDAAVDVLPGARPVAGRRPQAGA